MVPLPVPAQAEEPEMPRRPRRWVWWLIVLCIPLAIGARIALPWWQHSRMIAELERLGAVVTLDEDIDSRSFAPLSWWPELRIPIRPPELLGIECSSDKASAADAAIAIRIAQFHPERLVVLGLDGYELCSVLSNVPADQLQVTILVCDNCGIDRASLEHIHRWPRLTTINLTKCQLLETDLVVLSGNRTIEWVVFDKCPVTDDCLRILDAIPRLKRLLIFQSNISQQAIDQVRQRNPHLTVGVLNKRQSP